MAYQVTGNLKDDEFDIYREVLRGLGVEDEREFPSGRVGVVQTREEAEAIKQALDERLPAGSWEIIEL